MKTEPIIRFLYRLFYRRRYPGLQTEAFGLSFLNPVGLSSASVRTTRRTNRLSDLGLGFLCLDVSGRDIRQVVDQISVRDTDTMLAAEITSDFVRTYSLLYDFADLFIISPDNQSGLQAPEIPDICDILDELLSLRLCYEHYRPVILRISPGFTPDEVRSLLDFCLLSGVDGVAVSSGARVDLVREYTKGRLPVIVSAPGCTGADGRMLLDKGASLIETAPGRHSARKLLKYLSKPS